MPDLIYQIGAFLFDKLPGELVSPEQLQQGLTAQGLTAHDAATLGTALNLMIREGLIDASIQRDLVRLSLEGRDSWNDGSIVEVALGMQYVAQRYGPATVHIVVRGEYGEAGGSGFFSADYPGWVVTAAHVASLELLSISNGNDIIARPPFEKKVGPDGLDLALIQCPCPQGINPIRIEWGKSRIKPMDELLVLGYPPLPNLAPNLDHVLAQVRQIGSIIRDQRDSIVLSSTTLPGSSGGPVLSRQGRAVGVVDQENIGERLGHAPILAFTATPAFYLTDLRKPG